MVKSAAGACWQLDQQELSSAWEGKDVKRGSKPDAVNETSRGAGEKSWERG